MIPAWRHRSTSLAVRLLALAAVPVVALLVLGSQRITSEKRLADQASHVVNLVELQHAVASAYPPAQSERIALEGLARIDEAGISRDTVVGLIGIDLETTNATNARTLDQTLDDLTQRYRSIELADGGLLGDRLSMARGNLAAQRDLSRDARARTSDVRAVFDELFAVLDETLRGADPVVDGTGGHIENRIQLDALASVLITAGDHGDALLQSIVDTSPEIGLDAATTLAIHESSLDQFESSLGDADRATFAEVRTQLGDRAEIVSLTSDGTGTSIVAEQVSESAAAIFGHLEYVSALQAFSDDFHLTVAESLQDAADSAASRATQTQLLLWSIGVLTSLLAVLVLVSILLPIRRLRRRAETISNGELDLEVLPLQGPSDVRALTATTNDMLSTLHRVNDELSNLASGRLDTVSPDLPGAVGVALRESVERLADVTAELQRSQRLSSAIVTQAADAIWTLDEAGRVRTANEASSELTGVPIADQTGRYITEFLSQTHGEATVRAASGPQPKVLVARSDIDIGPERVTAIIAHDISERSRFEERLTYQAHHDALTGLPNRFALLQHLEHLVGTNVDDIAVLFVDLDTFKSVNDTQGHAVGDRVLADVAATLSRTVRDGEFVGRLGGDEFVVIARNFAQPADVIALGHRIIRELEQPHEHSGQVFVLSASVGVAIPVSGTSALDTIRQADNAVYQAKRRGRGRVELFDATMQERIEREAELELALRHAVRNNELRVHLQPVIDLTTGAIGGAEALARWDRPGHGLVPPAEFIPVAERSSLIFEVERWVLTAVCERLAEWRRWDPDSDLRIAVNIAGRHLIEGDLIADIDAALSLTGADPRMLELELTESQLLEDLDRATTVLDTLRARGISIAVDDFGTGYSSMTYLRHLPIDAVKIDRSFVARATEHGYDSTVIEALLTIGRTLDLDVVAEGVETDDQLDFVRARGCDRAQGFLLARPMPIDAAERIIFGDQPLAAAVSHAPVGSPV